MIYFQMSANKVFYFHHILFLSLALTELHFSSVFYIVDKYPPPPPKKKKNSRYGPASYCFKTEARSPRFFLILKLGLINPFFLLLRAIKGLGKKKSWSIILRSVSIGQKISRPVPEDTVKKKRGFSHLSTNFQWSARAGEEKGRPWLSFSRWMTATLLSTG